VNTLPKKVKNFLQLWDELKIVDPDCTLHLLFLPKSCWRKMLLKPWQDLVSYLTYFLLVTCQRTDCVSQGRTFYKPSTVHFITCKIPREDFSILLWSTLKMCTPTGTSGGASPTIQPRYANIAMFINYQHNQFLKKWIMMSCNLHSGTKSSGWLRHWQERGN
jgi:hypothetical protein